MNELEGQEPDKQPSVVGAVADIAVEVALATDLEAAASGARAVFGEVRSASALAADELPARVESTVEAVGGTVESASEVIGDLLGSLLG